MRRGGGSAGGEPQNEPANCKGVGNLARVSKGHRRKGKQVAWGFRKNPNTRKTNEKETEKGTLDATDKTNERTLSPAGGKEN